jgi:SAM-dependent methyltransferase
MIAEATQRSAGSGLPVEFRYGDAHRLDFPDSRFDSARAERVLQHLTDPARAIHELARVVRPGGSIVIGPDPDWESLSIACSDRSVARRLKAFLCDSLTSGNVAQQTAVFMRSLRLGAVAVTSGTVLLTRLDAADRLLQLTQVGLDACRAGAITEAELDALCSDLREQDEAGAFVVALTGYVTSAKKT